VLQQPNNLPSSTAALLNVQLPCVPALLAVYPKLISADCHAVRLTCCRYFTVPYVLLLRLHISSPPSSQLCATQLASVALNALTLLYVFVHRPFNLSGRMRHHGSLPVASCTCMLAGAAARDSHYTCTEQVLRIRAGSVVVASLP
jgi:hypothetical protein